MPTIIPITPEFIGVAAGLTYFCLSAHFFDPLITTPFRLLIKCVDSCIDLAVFVALLPFKMLACLLCKPGSARRRTDRRTYPS